MRSKEDAIQEKGQPIIFQNVDVEFHIYITSCFRRWIFICLGSASFAQWKAPTLLRAARWWTDPRAARAMVNHRKRQRPKTNPAAMKASAPALQVRTDPTRARLPSSRGLITTGKWWKMEVYWKQTSTTERSTCALILTSSSMIRASAVLKDRCLEYRTFSLMDINPSLHLLFLNPSSHTNPTLFSKSRNRPFNNLINIRQTLSRTRRMSSHTGEVRPQK